ncbi:MAG: cell envelope integrity protein CreD [Cellvibrionaceae bacterium]|nr:cell envelope integrity protein CreD [Cellvibrionaceae bacterium]
MNKPLLLKFIVMGFITLLLLVPLSLIHSMIQERGAYRNSVMANIASSTSRDQLLVGPVMVVPYTKTVTQWRKTENDKGVDAYTSKQNGQLFFLPETLKVAVQMKTELRKRGIYQATLYHAAINMRGTFKLPQDYGIVEGLESYTFQTPFLFMSVSDVRGIKSTIDVRFDGEDKSVAPGTRVAAFSNGVHVPVMQNIDHSEQADDTAFDLNFRLQGTSRLSILQLGKETEIAMTSDWPHPSFQGNYLPSTHEIGERGFSANWYSSHFANNVHQYLPVCARAQRCEDLMASAAQVALIHPVDHYVKSNRAIKYALLFVGLTFAGFFLFEVMKQLKIHPVQYSLVGISLAAFYLLLISLSEHIGFVWAYIVSAAACIFLLGFYLVNVLQSAKRAWLFALSLGLLYALLYGVLDSEDYALLMGAILLFAVLSVFMIATRKLDWYVAAKEYFPQDKQGKVT